MTLTIDVPGCPDAGLSPNARLHWRPRSRIVAEAKGHAKWAAHDVMPFAEDWPAFDGSVMVRATIAWAKGRRIVDGDNALAMLKPYVDGLNGIVWRDDKLCTFAPVVQERDPEGFGFVRFEVEDGA
jgi:hypothetical protein